jgi:uncharacterized protein (TIGR02453 family)
MNLPVETIQFLKDLKENNNKEWFHENKKRYDDIKKYLISFSNSLIKEVAKFDNAIAGIDPKKTIFRINRDIRFSKDKSPYKTNLGIFLNPSKDKNIELSGYYLHISPDDSFIGGGIHSPDNNNLKLIRQEIDYNFDEFKAIINDKDFVENFGEELRGDKLKTAPKGYQIDNPAIEYLKFKGFITFTNFEPSLISDSSFLDFCVNKFKVLYPFHQFFNKAITA